MKQFTVVDRFVYRLTARRWNKLIVAVLLQYYRAPDEARLTSFQLHALAAEFDPSRERKRACRHRIVSGELRVAKPVPAALFGEEPGA